jgi:hypothetical protein
MSVPMIPIASSLGGGFAPCFIRQPKPGACTTVNCSAKATTKCGHMLKSGKPCGLDVCEKHGKGTAFPTRTLCPSHQRELGLKVGR